MITQQILDLLSCPNPECNENFIVHEKGLLCNGCNRVYPIENDIIILLPEKSINNSTN